MTSWKNAEGVTQWHYEYARSIDTDWIDREPQSQSRHCEENPEATSDPWPGDRLERQMSMW